MPIIIIILIIGLAAGGCGKRLPTEGDGGGTDTTTVSK
jgi:hypothetical protein